MRKILTFGTILTLLLATSAAFAGGLVSQPVVSGPGTQFWASSDGTYVAYADVSHGRSNAYVLPLTGGRRIRLNSPGTGGTMGSLIPGTDEVLFQQWKRRSDLLIHDISAGTTKPVPAPVRSPHWEYWPVASQHLVLFNRDYLRHGRFTRRALLLFDRDTGRQHVMNSNLGHMPVFPGFAGDRYAAWTVCKKVCSILIYDSESPLHAQEKISRFPIPAGKSQYAPAIDEATGTIYYGESDASRCGKQATLRKAMIDGSNPVTLATLPPGISIVWTLTFAPNAGSGFQDLLYERYDCQHRRGDVHAFRSVDALVPLGIAAASTDADRQGASGSGTRPPLPPGAPTAAALHGRK